MKVHVTYARNKLAGTGKVLMERQFASLWIESDLSDEKAVQEEAMEKLSGLETLPKNEIKILSFSTR